jgi:hypothetical protein
MAMDGKMPPAAAELAYTVLRCRCASLDPSFCPLAAALPPASAAALQVCAFSLRHHNSQGFLEIEEPTGSKGILRNFEL